MLSHHPGYLPYCKIVNERMRCAMELNRYRRFWHGCQDVEATLCPGMPSKSTVYAPRRHRGVRYCNAPEKPTESGTGHLAMFTRYVRLFPDYDLHTLARAL